MASTAPYLKIVPPPDDLAGSTGEPLDDGPILVGAVLAAGAIPWAGLLLLGTWSGPELAVSALMLAAGVLELAGLARRRARDGVHPR